MVGRGFVSKADGRKRTALVLAFTRTRGWQSRDRSDDELADWSGYVRWARRAGALPASGVRAQSALGAKRPAVARRALGRARALRAAVYRLLEASATGVRLSPVHLGLLSRVAAAAARRRELGVSGEAAQWRWRAGSTLQPDFVLWQVAESAAALLSGEDAKRLRLCASTDCGWLFVDESRNGLRRWCSMTGCGNVEKARRYRSRHPG